MLERLADSAPESIYRRQNLSQVVSWSEEDVPITLEQYVASKLPATAQKLGISSRPVEGEIKDAYELDDDEIQKVTLARYESDDRDKVLSKDGKSYTYDDRLNGIRQRNELGVDLMRVSKQGIEFVEQLFKLGKVVGISDEPIDFSSFDKPV